MKKIGVIIGRFQVPELHRGHRYLFDTVIAQSDGVLILLGSTKKVSSHDPYAYAARVASIQKRFPMVHIREIMDQPSDTLWSALVDQTIQTLYPNGTITLYGSRKSFLEQYVGIFPTIFIDPIPSPSGTDIRNKKITNTGQVRS